VCDFLADFHRECAVRSGFHSLNLALYLGGSLATNLALLPGHCQLPVPFRVNLLLTPSQHVLWRDVTDRGIQTDVVVMLDVAPHQTLCVVQRKWRSRSDTLTLQRLMPAFDFPVRLRIVG